jgi:hypothetical protein
MIEWPAVEMTTLVPPGFMDITHSDHCIQWTPHFNIPQLQVIPSFNIQFQLFKVRNLSTGFPSFKNFLGSMLKSNGPRRNVDLLFYSTRVYEKVSGLAL